MPSAQDDFPPMAQGLQDNKHSPLTAAWETGAAPPGFCVLLTGLSGAGKTTLAKELARRWQAQLGRPMEILDGDECRKMLSSELGFSDEHRDLNVARLAFVASAISRQGGAVAIAAIAPREGARAQAMAALRQAGLACLVHVSTALNVCEARDPKGLYAKARQGLIPHFTGLGSPYDEPNDPDLRLDLGKIGVDEAASLIESWAVQAKLNREALKSEALTAGTLDPAARAKTGPR